MLKFQLLLSGILCVVMSGCEKAVDVEPVTADETDKLVIEDFDAGMPPNYLGGDYGSWDSNPDDSSQGAEIYFDNDIRVGDSGYSLGIDYDVESLNPAFNGFWMKFNGENFEPYEHLVFSIKGNNAAGFTKKIKLELKNKADESGTYMLSGITDEWQEIKIPLRSFRGIRDFSSMDEFVIVFEDKVATVKKGAIHIDNISVQ